MGVVRETDDDGTVSLGFEDGIGVWLPYDALERESDLERRTSELAAMAAEKAAEAAERPRVAEADAPQLSPAKQRRLALRAKGQRVVDVKKAEQAEREEERNK